MSAQQHGAWDDEDDDFDEAPAGGDDSSVIRNLRKADKAKARRIAELEAALAEQQKASRSRSMSEVLQARSLNPKIAALIPSDVEPTEDAVGKWLDEYGDVFGVSQSNGSDEGDEIARSMASVDAAAAGLAPKAESSDMASRIAGAQTREELEALLFGGGAGR